MGKGWISLHRKILDNPMFVNRKCYSRFEAWIWLLLRANHTEGKVLIGNEMLKVKAGQLITSQKQLCKKFKWGTTKLRAFLELLQSEGMIDWEALPKATCVSIMNYGTYQNLQTDNKLQKNQKQTQSKSQVKTNNTVSNVKTIEIRERDFINKVCAEGLKTTPSPHPDIINEFCDYWTEKNTSGKKMLFEMQRTFDVGRRLKKWIRNQEEWGRNKKVFDLAKFRRDTTGFPMAYCESCGSSDSYTEFEIRNSDSKCCNAKLLAERKINGNNISL